MALEKIRFFLKDYIFWTKNFYIYFNKITNKTLKDIIENINCNIISKTLKHEDSKEIYSQDLQNYIETFLTEENILACTFLNCGMVNKLLQLFLQSVMIAKRAIVEMMHILNPNIEPNVGVHNYKQHDIDWRLVPKL